VTCHIFHEKIIKLKKIKFPNTDFKLYNIWQTSTPHHIPQTTFALSRGRGRGRTTCRGRVQPTPQGLPASSIPRVSARGRGQSQTRGQPHTKTIVSTQNPHLLCSFLFDLLRFM
jgi:hypothetical protein